MEILGCITSISGPFVSVARFWVGLAYQKRDFTFACLICYSIKELIIMKLLLKSRSCLVCLPVVECECVEVGGERVGGR